MIYIGLLIVALILGAHIYRLRQFNTYKQDLMDKQEIAEELHVEDYNGADLNIREEERSVWDSLTRKQKRFIIKEQEKKIKSGKYLRMSDGRIITRAEAKKHGLI